ncbi:MAG: HAMP domain-containing protein, partial [Gammaproteobacteria bacterium]|nr:HAMP domain-containing protein [Gammaproteobacteria bacterium]
MKLQIKGKLFIAILFTNLVMIGCLYFLITWSFSSSFKTYLDSHQENSLMPLVSALSEQHALKGNWDWIDSQRDLNWRDLIDKYMSDEGQVRERRGGGRGKRGRPPQRFEEHQLTPPDWQDPEPPPPSNRQNLLLADSDKSVIIGPPNRELIYVNWIAIQSNNKTVGFLGYRKINEITSEVDQAFVSKLISDLSWSLIAVIILTALVTLELARRFIKPIKRLSKATHSLASGNYSVKLSEESNDEIGDLSRDFNQLASTLETNLSVRKKWISDISHELRTPVAVLRAEIEAVQDGVRQVSDETVDSLHKEILRL